MGAVSLTDEFLKGLNPASEKGEFYDREFEGPGSFGVRVGSGGRKAYFLIYPLHGKRVRITLGTYPVTSLKDARREALSILKQAQRGRDPAAERKRYRRSASFSDLSREFMDQHADRFVGASTRAEYRRILDRELLPVWKNRKPEDITTAEIAELLRDISDVRGSPVMANRVRLLLNKIYNFGMGQSLVGSNPVKSAARPADAQPREFALSMDQVQSLWAQLGKESLPVQTAFKLMLLTGQRPGDVLGMRWTDITLDTWMVGSSATPHRVYLSPPAQQMLRALQQDVLSRQPKGADEPEFIFAGRYGAPMRYLRKAAERISQDSSGFPDWSPSDLRRTFEVRIRDLGIRPDLVAVLLNQRTALKRIKAFQSDYNYYPEVQQALTRWARAVVPKPGGDKSSSGAKIIPLFGN